jgi:photosystem II stability/assembly factor-like uncharacterized protein
MTTEETTMLIAMDGGLLRASGADGHWEAAHPLPGVAPRCLAADPQDPERVWCGTEGAGLWASGDGGRSWRSLPGPLDGTSVSAIAASGTERGAGRPVLYAGTDPTRLYRSEDGGRTWEELRALLDLPSAPTWSFPPRPDTSHVRWIGLDPLRAGRLYVCIEAGALVRSNDGGCTWSDRVAGAPLDTHTLGLHPLAPDRLYSAAGDGFSTAGQGYRESRDGGETWSAPDEGLDRHYLYGLAVDSGDPDTVVVSAASSPRSAHDLAAAEAGVYRRSSGGTWEAVTEGLPVDQGTTRAILAADPSRRGCFASATNRGLYRSSDGARTWARVPLELPPGSAQALVLTA